MLIPIILVLLWVVPVVIHAVVVSKKTYGFRQVSFYHYKTSQYGRTSELKERIEYATGVDPYYDGGKSGNRYIADEAAMWSSNFAMMIPSEPYYPHAKWRTHHGMIDLYDKQMNSRTNSGLYKYFQPSWGDKVDKYGNLPDWANDKYLDKLKELNSTLYQDEIRKQPLQSNEPDNG